MCSRIRVRWALAMATIAMPFAVQVRAQSHPATPASVEQAGNVAKDAPSTKMLELEDYAAWNRITSPALSADGKWMTFTYSPNEGGQTMLHVKSLDGGKDYAVSVGSGAGGGRAGGAGAGGRGGGGGNAPSFTEDSKWAAYLVTPAARGGAGGARGGRGRGTAPAQAQRATTDDDASTVAHLEVLNLATGEKIAIPGAASWKFSSDSRWLAVKLARAAAEAAPAADAAGGRGRGGRGGGGGAAGGGGGGDMIVRDMSTGVVRNVGNVNQFEFDDSGKLLAYTVDAPERLGNGVYLLDPASGVTTPLSTATADYDALAWSGDGTGLAVMRGDKVRGMKQKANALLAWSGVSSTGGKAFVYDPAQDGSFPKGMVLSEYAAPRWSRDGSKVFVGIKEQEAEVAAADSNKANVDIWHYKDQTPQMVQEVQ
ncbi:MAG TPA: hypothetical protein VHV78_14790, partial [Gemmatimonadaceae bacterium]|nr:hypothetical protein [Gemmatimonadaceae bacterium]